MKVLNPLIEGYTDVWDITRFLEVLKLFVLESFSSEKVLDVENLGNGIIRFEVISDRVSWTEGKKKLVAMKFLESLRNPKNWWKELLKRRDKYIFVFNWEEKDEVLDFIAYSISELENFRLKILKAGRDLYLEIDKGGK